MQTYAKPNFQTKWMSIGKAADYLGISRDTLRRWEIRKMIKAFRSPTNRRYYTKKQLDMVMINKPLKKTSLILFSILSFIVTLIFSLLFLRFFKV